LRARKQGAEETTREYYYDVLDLCRRVNPRMAEAEKLKCPWRGLKPSVIEKHWSLKPTTCDGFLEEVKRLEELTSRSEEWALGVLGETIPPAKDERMDRLERRMECMLGAVAANTPENPPQQGWKTGDAQQGPPWLKQGRRPVNLRWTPDGRPVCGKCDTEGHIIRDCPRSNQQQQMDFGRTPDGQFVCYGCGGAGHIQRFCPGGQEPGPPPQQRQSGVGQQLIGLIGMEDRNTEEKVWPVRKIDFKRLVVQDVLCGGRRIPSVIDTGAEVSVCSPKLVEELKLTVRPWRANDLVSVEGKEICPGGAAQLVISNGEIRVEGEALVLDGDIDLLLGKDLLGKLGTRLKIGALPEIFIGERPIGARTSIGSNGPLTGAQNVETAREEVRTSLEQVQERQKELYAKHMAAVGFNPGEEVLGHRPFRKVGQSEKLLHRWLRPYVVIRRASALNPEMKKPRSKQMELTHVVRIKRFVRKGE
jgi:hypothetical protein